MSCALKIKFPTTYRSYCSATLLRHFSTKIFHLNYLIDSFGQVSEAMSDWETTNAEEVNEYVKKNGVSGINEFFRNQLERSEKEGVNIGITGDSGAGKSSFINMFRG